MTGTQTASSANQEDITFTFRFPLCWQPFDCGGDMWHFIAVVNCREEIGKKESDWKLSKPRRYYFHFLIHILLTSLSLQLLQLLIIRNWERGVRLKAQQTQKILLSLSDSHFVDFCWFVLICWLISDSHFVDFLWDKPLIAVVSITFYCSCKM